MKETNRKGRERERKREKGEKGREKESGFTDETLVKNSGAPVLQEHL